MADFQLAYLEKERGYTADSGTIYLDLPSAEQVSMLMVEFTVSNTSPTSRDYERTILDVVGKVEVLLAGAKTAYSCCPEVGSYLAWLAAKKVPPHRIRERGETTLRLPIYFGRYPFDPEYMLDTSLYPSVQLQIPYALNTTYETTGSSKLTVWYARPIDKQSLKGFVRSRTINTYSSTGSAETKEIDLPTGLPWHSVGFRAYDVDCWPSGNVTDVDLDVDQGRLHLFDGRMEDLISLQQLWFGESVRGNQLWAMPVSGDYWQTFLGDVEAVHFTSFAASAWMFASSAIYGPSAEIRMVDADGNAAVNAVDVYCQAEGSLPYSGVALGYFPDAPYAAPLHSDIKIEYTLGAYTTLLETWLQEIVSGRL